MVKFGEELGDQRIQEWRYYYVDYQRLKGWIKELETGEAAQNFFDELTLSIERVEQFYCSQEKAILKHIEADLNKPPANKDEGDKRSASIKADIDKLAKFAEINREALRKIGKKFDKGCLPARRQPGVIDMGRNTSGQAENWGSAAEELQTRIVAKIPAYTFGKSADRLLRIRASVQDWKTGATQSVRIGEQDLEAPLLLARQPSTVHNLQLSSGLATQLKSKWRERYACPAIYFAAVTAVVVGAWWKHAASIAASGETSVLNGQSFVVIYVTIITLTLLVWQWKSDSVMMSATLTLNILGMIDTTEAWGAFANSVVLSVAALSVVGDAVAQTGIVDILFAKLLGDTKNLYAAQVKMLIPCCIGAASISNTAVMACSMPAIEDWCNKNKTHQAFFLMSISYLMLIGGTFAVFSTSTNLVAQALLVNHKLEPLSTFELGLPAFANMITGLFYLMFATPIVLRRFLEPTAPKENGAAKAGSSAEKNQEIQAGARSFFVRVRVLLRFEQVKTLQESGLLDCLAPGVEFVDKVERHGTSVVKLGEVIGPSCVLQFDDIVSMRVLAAGIEHLRGLPGFMFLSQDSSDLYATMQHEKRELAEVILDQGSPLVGHRLNKAKTFQFYAGAVIAVRLKNANKIGQKRARSASQTSNASGEAGSPRDEPHDPAPQMEKEVFLERGDQVILDVPKGFAEQWRESADFVMLRKLGNKSEDDGKDLFKAYASGLILVVMLFFVAFNILPLFVCALAAIVALVVCKCATAERMKKAVPLNVVLTIVGAFGLGNAIGKHGVATALATFLVSVFSPFGQIGLLIAVWLVIVMLGVIFHGTAVVTLMFPLCHQIAIAANIPLHQMVAVLCYSVACQMLSPVSYNTNLMAYAACPDYRFSDFTKLGFPLCILLFIQSIPMCRLYWPDSACVVTAEMLAANITKPVWC